MTSDARILIVDDQVLIGMAFADELKLRGYSIVGPYSTTAAADRKFEEDKPSIAFLDVNLGKGRTSHEFARKLISKQVPVVFLTGYSELPVSNSEFDEIPVLSKPVAIEKVVEVISETLTNGQF